MPDILSIFVFFFFLSLMPRRECCAFSNGEYVKSGLAEFAIRIVNATEEVNLSFVVITA